MPQDPQDELAAAIGRDSAAQRLAAGLLDAFEKRWTHERIDMALVAEFRLSEGAANLAQQRVRDGVVAAISGNPAKRPDSEREPLACGTFEIVWNSFNRDSFFSRRRTPSRKWLDWHRDENAQTSAL